MLLNDYLNETIDNLNRTIEANLSKEMESAISTTLSVIKKGKIIAVAGNGGSMADAQHLTAELVNYFTLEHKALPFLTLGVNAATSTAWANDHDYESQMLREFSAFSQVCGLLIVISTSGKSKNIGNLIAKAKELNIPVVAFASKAAMANFTDIPDINFTVPVPTTSRIQEIHINLIHYYCEEIEKQLSAE